MNQSTWGAAPPDAFDSAAESSQPSALAHKRPAPEPYEADAAPGGGGLPAAFKKRPQVAGSETAHSVPAAFRRGRPPSRPVVSETQQTEAAQAANPMQSMMGGGSEGSNPMQNMMAMMGNGGSEGANPMQNMMGMISNGGSEGANPMQNMMAMMTNGGAQPKNPMQNMMSMMGNGGSEPANPMQNMMAMMGNGGSEVTNPMQNMMGMMGMVGMMRQMNQMNQMSQMSQMMSQMGQMPQMGQMATPAEALLAGGGGGEAMAPPTVDMSSWASLPDDTQRPEDEQARAVHDAVIATQQAQYLQQVQFLQQVREHANKTPEHIEHGKRQSRFKEDYAAFKLCVHYPKGTCMQGKRCIYAHCFEELHPASPDMPHDEKDPETEALSEMKETSKEQDSAPNMRLRKKRDLCRKFMDTGKCNRGNTCPNAHGNDELGKLAFVLYDKVKLSICNAWERGKCSYGEKCLHAHGDHQIGQKRREFFEGPPMKRRADGQSIEDWRYEILRDPDAAPFPC